MRCLGLLPTRCLGPLAAVCSPVACPSDWCAWAVQLAAHSPCSYFSFKQPWLLYPTHYLSFTCSLTPHRTLCNSSTFFLACVMGSSSLSVLPQGFAPLASVNQYLLISSG